MRESISDHEYLSLIIPQAALAKLTGVGIDESEAKAKIAERLISGRVQAVAHRAFVATVMGEETYDRMRITRFAWEGVEIPEQFWTGSDIRLPRSSNPNVNFGLGAFHDGPTRCLGVRLVPLDIDLLLEEDRQAKAAAALSAPSPEPETEDLAAVVAKALPLSRRLLSRAPTPIAPLRMYASRPVGTLEQIAPELAPYLRENVPENVPTTTITPREFDTWYAAQSSEIRTWGGLKLRQKCSQDHGGRRVLKKATDHITKGRKTGRKTGSKNVPRR